MQAEEPKSSSECCAVIPSTFTVKFGDCSTPSHYVLIDEESVARFLQQGAACRDPVVAAFLYEWRLAPHSDITLTYILAKCVEVLVEQKTAMQEKLIDVLEKMPSVVQTPLANPDNTNAEILKACRIIARQSQSTIIPEPCGEVHALERPGQEPKQYVQLDPIQGAIAKEQERIMSILQDLLDRADSAAVRETLRLAVRRIQQEGEL